MLNENDYRAIPLGRRREPQPLRPSGEALARLLDEPPPLRSTRLASCRSCRQLVVVSPWPPLPGEVEPVKAFNPDLQAQTRILSVVGVEAVVEQGFGPTCLLHETTCGRDGS